MMIRTAAALAMLPILAAPSISAESGWSSSGEAQLRLLAAPADATDGIAAGVEIAMAPGWHTYWRNPGQAGIPPMFDFSRSDNLAEVAVDYPAPERLDDGASISMVYHDQVVFPLRVVPEDPQKPVRLALSARFGVCRDICIPVSIDAELSVGPAGPADPLVETRLAQAAARVPGDPDPDRFDLELAAHSADELHIEVTAPQAYYSDLFVHGGPDWLAEQPQFVGRDGATARYRLPVGGGPAGASLSGQLLHFVAVAGSSSIEKTVRIP